MSLNKKILILRRLVFIAENTDCRGYHHGNMIKLIKVIIKHFDKGFIKSEKELSTYLKLETFLDKLEVEEQKNEVYYYFKNHPGVVVVNKDSILKEYTVLEHFGFAAMSVKACLKEDSFSSLITIKDLYSKRESGIRSYNINPFSFISECPTNIENSKIQYALLLKENLFLVKKKGTESELYLTSIDYKKKIPYTKQRYSDILFKYSQKTIDEIVENEIIFEEYKDKKELKEYLDLLYLE